MTTSDVTADSLIAQALWRIPPVPGTLAYLLNVVHDDASEAADLAAVIAVDEILATHVMRVANSAMLGFRARATTVGQAVARIGSATVFSMAVAQAVNQGAPLTREVGGIPRLEYWEHNWAAATAAAYLAPLFGLHRGETHLAGLLHDVGKLVLASGRPAKYAECVAAAAVPYPGLPLHEVERRLLDTDHAVIGARALRAWGLPEFTAVAAEGHHDQPAATGRPVIVQLVRAANWLAHESDIGRSGNCHPEPVLGGQEAALPLTAAHLERALQHLAGAEGWLRELVEQFAVG